VLCMGTEAEFLTQECEADCCDFGCLCHGSLSCLFEDLMWDIVLLIAVLFVLLLLNFS